MSHSFILFSLIYNYSDNHNRKKEEKGAPSGHRDPLDRRGGGRVREMAVEPTGRETVVAERGWQLASSEPAQPF